MPSVGDLERPQSHSGDSDDRSAGFSYRQNQAPANGHGLASHDAHMVRDFRRRV